MLYLLGAIFLLGITLMIVAVRGRVVGDDPHCAACGFNLRGLESGTTRCPECGADTSAPDAIETGTRRARRGLIWAVAVVSLASGIVLGTSGWHAAREYDWSPFKPIGWLIEDVDTAGPDVASASASAAQLRARVCSDRSPQADVDRIIDAALARQADRSKPSWNDNWADVIAAAGGIARLDEQRLKRYLTQAARTTLVAKPRLRHRQRVDLQVEAGFDRLIPHSELKASFQPGEIRIDDVVVFPASAAASRETEMSFPGSVPIDFRFALDDAVMAKLKYGPHTLGARLHVHAAASNPFISKPCDFDVTATAPVELLPAGAVVDEFPTPASQEDRRAMVGTLSAKVYVNASGYASGYASVFFNSRELPHPLAARVVVAQGETEHTPPATCSSRPVTASGCRAPAGSNSRPARLRRWDWSRCD